MASNKNKYNEIANNAVTNCEPFAIISKTYGNDGEMLVKLNANINKDIDPIDTIADSLNEPLWIIHNSIAVPLFVTSIEQLGNSKAIIVFQDFEDNDTAKLLLAKKLYSDRLIPEKKKHPLLNYQIFDNNSQKEFVVVDVLETKVNTLLELEDTEHNLYTIPLAEPLIETQNDKKRTIVMNLPEGILDI